MHDTILFKARKIITLDPNQPEATHAAVRDGRILAVGGSDCAAPWGGGKVDDQFAKQILIPGFVEGHAHMMAGAMWDFHYAGYQDRFDPDGRLWKGLTDIDSVIKGLHEAAATLGTDEALIAWGFDPIFLTGERLTRHHLDTVSRDKPIAIMHSNFHLLTVNSAVLEMVGYNRSSNIEGLARDDQGEPNGELQEIAAMYPVMRRLGIVFRNLAVKESSIRGFARTATRVGVTTSTDLFSELPEEDLENLLALTGSPDYALRVVPALNGLFEPPAVIARRIADLRKCSTNHLRLGAVKLMVDGSIQGYTARLKWPGYVAGQVNGIWNTSPEQLLAQITGLHTAGIQMHIHVNGDEASQAALDALEAGLGAHPRRDHRHTLQHCQMADEAQFRQMAALGVCVNLFANHLWHFGDQHYELTMGPERASRINACRSALDNRVPLAIHSDAPVTPMDPLHVAWCAVNRLTPSGRVLGENQRISVAEALHAVTLGPAYTLKLDREIGSIETGKIADFAILEEDPLAVNPKDLKDIPVKGTVYGGKPFLV